jgi:hypothetical protein
LVVRDGAEFTEGFDVISKQYDETVDMDPLIGIYRDKYVEDLTRRLGVNEDRLPAAYTTMTLLNPLLGLKPVIVGSKLMTEIQYDHAREAIVRLIQEELDSKNPITSSGANGDDDNSLDGEIVEYEDNDNSRLAEREMRRFESFKMQKFIPKLKLSRKLSNIDANGRLIELGVGPVETKGEDLPSGKNIATYVDPKGRFDALSFFKDHTNTFPNLFIIAQREASRRVVEEVGCERFFGLSGYISQPRRSQLGVRNYERISMLASILASVYIDPKEVAAEYLARSKRGAWKKDNTVESLKCFNLERMIAAEEMGMAIPDDVEMEKYLTGDVDLDVDVIEVDDE